MEATEYFDVTTENGRIVLTPVRVNRADRLRLLASRDTTVQLIRVVAYPKFGLTADERQDLLDDYLTYCETVPIADSPPVVPEYRDPFDRPFLEMALVGRADTLINADTDILALAESFAFPYCLLPHSRCGCPIWGVQAPDAKEEV